MELASGVTPEPQTEKLLTDLFPLAALEVADPAASVIDEETLSLARALASSVAFLAAMLLPVLTTAAVRKPGINPPVFLVTAAAALCAAMSDATFPATWPAARVTSPAALPADEATAATGAAGGCCDRDGAGLTGAGTGLTGTGAGLGGAGRLGARDAHVVSDKLSAPTNQWHGQNSWKKETSANRQSLRIIQYLYTLTSTIPSTLAFRRRG